MGRKRMQASAVMSGLALTHVSRVHRAGTAAMGRKLPQGLSQERVEIGHYPARDFTNVMPRYSTKKATPIIRTILPVLVGFIGLPTVLSAYHLTIGW
jgi:hypothetical protein